jgi:hypothetical protein
MRNIINLYFIAGSFFSGMFFTEYRNYSLVRGVAWGVSIAYLWPIIIIYFLIRRHREKGI